MQQKQWQYGMTIVFGLLLLGMPWLMGFHDDLPVRSWNFFVVGGALFACGMTGLHLRSYSAAWLAPALGLWTMVSPWIVGFTQNVAARNSSWIIGAYVVVLTVWALRERLAAERGSLAHQHA